MMDINVDLLQCFIIFFDKKASGNDIKNEGIGSKQLREEFHKAVIRKFNKRKEHSPFMDNICGADLVDMQLISKFNTGFRFSLYVVDIYSKYACLIPLNDNKGIKITDTFQKILDESHHK